MYVVTLHLKTTRADEIEINRRYHALSHIHNTLVSHAKKLIIRLEHDNEYQSWRKEYSELKNKKNPDSQVKNRKKELGALMNERREALGLTKNGLESYIKVCAKRYSKLLSSHQVQAEAGRVWKGVDSYLFGKGKQIHYKKFDAFETIGGKSKTNGVKFHQIGDEKLAGVISWLGLEIGCLLPRKEEYKEYIRAELCNEVKYCMIKRKMFNNGWHYYVQVVIKGEAPSCDSVDGEPTGVDPGVSTVAAVSDNGCFLEELAPKAIEYEKKIADLQRQMDDSRRATNPNKYNPDGTIRKGNKEKWVFSHHYYELKRRLKTLYRKKKEYTLHEHRRKCNRLLNVSRHVLAEKMDFAALQKRASETKREEKATPVKNKDGSVKEVFKYKRKKRFGHSINSRSPSLFLSELKRKCKSCGGTYNEVKTKMFRASQYDHVADQYIKVPLSQRMKQVGGKTVQRDLYSAFLIKNADLTLKHTDREKCIYGFESFVKEQDELIRQMKASGKSMKQCFGF